jgi:hypothetical protein
VRGRRHSLTRPPRAPPLPLCRGGLI